MIGQDSLVASIEELIRYCVSKQARYPDVCLAGPPGVGKTSMSRMIAQKLQAECVLLSGSDMTSAARLISAFAEHGLFEDEMHDGAYVVARSVCFIDEAHSMGRSFVAWLLQAMDDVRLSSNEGKCYSFANVTFILATTDPGRLPSAMRSRAEPVFLRDYTLRELCGIVWLHGRKELDHDLDREVCEEIAARMRANPRRAVRSLTQAIIPHAYCQLQARDGAFDPTPSEVGRAITTNLVANYFEKKGIDVNGLDDNARSLLRYLERQGVTSEVHLCQALGISTRSDFLSLDEYVTRLGLISVSTRGRQLTSVGRRYVRQVFPLRAHIGHPSSNAEMEIV
ncbi:MAG: AAA family ATPase [Dokdonella sp.]